MTKLFVLAKLNKTNDISIIPIRKKTTKAQAQKILLKGKRKGFTIKVVSEAEAKKFLGNVVKKAAKRVINKKVTKKRKVVKRKK